ncbi:hypothetical protein AB0K43_09130 [Kitasatospora sp. NPDC049258]|uniref:hypothetical protein n=1 Tax=Kitasatospora sp. NPDC049258 TaxID=3155394 RepID=UPI00343F7457
MAPLGPGRIGWYAADVQARRPATDPPRHGPYCRMAARNRVAWRTVWRLTRAGRPPIV